MTGCAGAMRPRARRSPGLALSGYRCLAEVLDRPIPVARALPRPRISPFRPPGPGRGTGSHVAVPRGPAEALARACPAAVDSLRFRRTPCRPPRPCRGPGEAPWGGGCSAEAFWGVVERRRAPEGPGRCGGIPAVAPEAPGSRCCGPGWPHKDALVWPDSLNRCPKRSSCMHPAHGNPAPNKPSSRRSLRQPWAERALVAAPRQPAGRGAFPLARPGPHWRCPRPRFGRRARRRDALGFGGDLCL